MFEICNLISSGEVSLLGLCLGNSIGWVSPMLPLLTSPHPPIGTDPLSIDTIAWLGSINYIGSIIGTLFWSVAADRLGRKTAATLVALPYILSWTLILVAKTTEWLLLARVLAGIGNNGVLVNVPVFISEITQDHLRGYFASFVIIFVNAGILLAYIIGTYLKYYGIAIYSLIIPIVFILTFVWLPETPLFYWKNGQTNKAEQSLLWYRGGDTVETEKVLTRYKLFTSKQSKKPSLKALVATRGTTKAMIIGIALMISIHFSGIFVILNFSVRIFEISGTSITPYQAAIVMGSAQLIFSCFSSVFIDRLGRKLLLVGALIIMTVLLAILGSYLYFLSEQSVHSLLRWVPVIALSLYVIVYAVGVGPVPMVILSEIYPPEVRGLAISQVQLVSNILGFSVVKLFPTMNKLFKLHGCFWLYSLCCSFFAVFFYFYLPETKDKPHDVILRLLNNEELTLYDTTAETEQLHKQHNSTVTTERL